MSAIKNGAKEFANVVEIFQGERCAMFICIVVSFVEYVVQFIEPVEQIRCVNVSSHCGTISKLDAIEHAVKAALHGASLFTHGHIN